MIKNIDDLKRHLIVVVDLAFDTYTNFNLRVMQNCLKVGHLVSYCYGFIDSWCNENNKRESKDLIKTFIANYIIDSIKYSNEEEKDKYE